MARILIADDDRDFADQLTLVLQAAGHEVLVCANGKEALVSLTAFPADWVILDMRMAYTMDGLDTLWQIRRHPAGSQAKVLIASALDGQIGDIQQKATQLGIAGWLQKPFETQDLLQRLENAG